MAGIGFVLKKLIKRENLTGIVQAYFHATVASSGPWLFTVLALASFFFVFKNWQFLRVVENFRGIILYNFAFSLVFSSPITILTTRYLADSIYRREISDTVGLLFGSLTILWAIQLPIATAFYFFYAHLTIGQASLAVINYLIISSIWLLSIFITAVRYYRAVTLSFGLGLIVSVLAAVYLGLFYSFEGMLAGFTLGLACILASLIALVLVEYPKKVIHLFNFLTYTKKYWQLALGGLIYNAAIWVDKWIMWAAPEAEVLPIGLAVFPNYDGAMFIAYLTIVPGLAMFLLIQETMFFEAYIQFYHGILENITLKKIYENHRHMIHVITQGAGSLILLQSCVTFITLMTAPYLFQLFDINYVKLGIFRFGVIGSLFQVLILSITTLLAYFDYRSGLLKVQMFFLMTNASFTYLTLHLGFPYYGYGYLLSTILTFVFAAFVLIDYVRELPYHAFITSNPSVENK